MVHRTRYILLLSLLALLFASCGNPTRNASGISGTPTTQSQADSCPESLHSSSPCLSPQALRRLYGIQSLYQQGYTGKGQTIIDIVSFGSPTLQADMQKYDQTFGLPAIDLQTISPLHEQEQDPQNDKQGWASETTLDVQIIHALAPGARVIVLTSPVAETEGTMGLPEMRQLEQYTLDHNLGTIVTHSWGASELTLQDAQGQSEIQKWNSVLATGVAQYHMTYLASSGDNGATDYSDLQGSQLAHVPTTSFLADSPWVTGVGGTSVQYTGNSAQETAWNGSGGGFSRFYSMPDYQKLLPEATQSIFDNRRGVPDVSADADPMTGTPIYMNGIWTLAGGTSASAPVWAAVVALGNQLAGHPLGLINPGLYKIAASANYTQDFHDITRGNNDNSAAHVKGYNAAPGWDPATGLGTPNASSLLPALISEDK